MTGSRRCTPAFFASTAAVGFATGFVATLVAHQPVLLLLHELGLTQRAAFDWAPAPPFGVPALLSVAVWGGTWGTVFVAVRQWVRPRLGWRLPETVVADVLVALPFGALVPSLGTWFVAAPLRGQGLGGGWHASAMLTTILVNAAWGLATGLLLRIVRRPQRPH